MKRENRILILILYSGENELEESLKVLKNQSYKNWKYKIFSYLSNKKAHDTLYSYIMAQASNFDLFMKLDADMILINEYVLENIVKYFNANPNVDQANFAVHDVMSDQDIMGLLVFTGRAKWNGGDEKLFVDHSPIIPGRRLLVWDKPAPIAIHSANPHLFQAFHFGAHRATKAIQRGRSNKKWIQSALQWHLLYRVWVNFQMTKDIKMGMIMAGAFCVWKGEVDLDIDEYKNQSLERVFEKYKSLDGNTTHQVLSRVWKRALYRNHLLYFLLWPKIIEYKTRCRFFTWLNNIFWSHVDVT